MKSPNSLKSAYYTVMNGSYTLKSTSLMDQNTCNESNRNLIDCQTSSLIEYSPVCSLWSAAIKSIRWPKILGQKKKKFTVTCSFSGLDPHVHNLFPAIEKNWNFVSVFSSRLPCIANPPHEGKVLSRNPLYVKSRLVRKAQTRQQKVSRGSSFSRRIYIPSQENAKTELLWPRGDGNDRKGGM